MDYDILNIKIYDYDIVLFKKLIVDSKIQLFMNPNYNMNINYEKSGIVVRSGSSLNINSLILIPNILKRRALNYLSN